MGRCGRNGNPGLSIILVDDFEKHIVSYGSRKCVLDERELLAEIKNVLNTRIRPEQLPSHIGKLVSSFTKTELKEDRDYSRFPTYQEIVNGMVVY